MNNAPPSPLSTLAITAIGSGIMVAMFQAASWKTVWVSRLVTALPILAALLVFLAVSGTDSERVCLTRTKEELQTYVVYTVVSFVFVLVWLACLDPAVAQTGSVRVGVCASGAIALAVWLVCMSALLLLVLS